MKKILATLATTALVVGGTAGSAEAAIKTGVCEDRDTVNLRICSSLNFESGRIWTTGQATELFNTALATYTVQGSIERKRCASGGWQGVAAGRPVSGNDKLQVTAPSIAFQQGYRYRAVVRATSSPTRLALVTSPVVSRCG